MRYSSAANALTLSTSSYIHTDRHAEDAVDNPKGIVENAGKEKPRMMDTAAAHRNGPEAGITDEHQGGWEMTAKSLYIR